MGTVLAIAVVLVAVLGLALGGRHLLLKALRPGGFECSLRTLSGERPGLSDRFRAGYAGRELDNFVWRRIIWPSPKVSIPAAAIHFEEQRPPGRRQHLFSLPASFAVIPVELPDGTVLELALSQRRLDRVIAVLR
ncbi:MAG TPA: hypothetical protein VIC35_08595 [Acidimicrobiia bacterium]|jgi:hypothetical protein